MKAVPWMGIYPKVIVLRCTWYWYLVLGIGAWYLVLYLNGDFTQGYCTYAVCVSQTPCTWERSQAAFFFSIYHPQQCQLRDFWPGWHGNRKQSKSWIGTTTHQNFMIILIYTLLQRENLLTFWCVVYHDEDQRSIIVYYDEDQRSIIMYYDED